MADVRGEMNNIQVLAKTFKVVSWKKLDTTMGAIAKYSKMIEKTPNVRTRFSLYVSAEKQAYEMLEATLVTLMTVESALKNLMLAEKADGVLNAHKEVKQPLEVVLNSISERARAIMRKI